MIKKILYASFFIFLFFNFFSSIIVYAIDFPELTGRVVDTICVLNGPQFSKMVKRLEEYEQKTGNQMVVCFIKTTDYYPIENYSIKLAEKWKIGYKGKDNGIIMLFAMFDRKMRIEVGYGLEPYLTDSEAKLIIEKILVPAFKKDRYYDGIMQAIDIIEKETMPDPDDIILKRYLPEESKFLIKSQKKIDTIFWILVLIGVIQSLFFVLWLEDKLSFKFFLFALIFGLLYIIFFSFIFKLQGFNFGYLLMTDIMGGTVSIFLLSIFFPPKTGKYYGGSSSYRSTGSNSSSYSSSSYDSFSGGGGSFGGGGASGSW
ncbi:MAG: TPM domain-containing protein [Exilispira sp.]